MEPKLAFVAISGGLLLLFLITLLLLRTLIRQQFLDRTRCFRTRSSCALALFTLVLLTGALCLACLAGVAYLYEQAVAGTAAEGDDAVLFAVCVIVWAMIGAVVSSTMLPSAAEFRRADREKRETAPNRATLSLLVFCISLSVFTVAPPVSAAKQEEPDRIVSPCKCTVGAREETQVQPQRKPFTRIGPSPRRPFAIGFQLDPRRKPK